VQITTSDDMSRSAYTTDQRIKFGQALAVMRGLMGLTQSEAAEWLGMSVGTLRNAERNGTVTRATAALVELGCGRSLECLIDWYDAQRDWVLELAKDNDIKGTG